MPGKSYRKVFATVGTTQFDKLVAALDTVEVQMALKERLHAEALTIQVGNTALEPKSRVDGLDVTIYRFKPTLIDDIQAADLIISHCGAGTILEILKLGKKSIGVINTDLLDNHQVELAEAMQQKGLMVIADSPTLLCDVIRNYVTAEPGTMEVGASRVLLEEISSLVSL